MTAPVPEQSRSHSFFDLISDVAGKEMQMVGIEPAQASIGETAEFTESVRRIQVWTFERMAEMQPEGDPMREMFEALALGVARVEDISLWTGRPA